MLNDLKDALKLYLSHRGEGFGVFETPVRGLVIGHTDGQKLPGYALYRPALGIVVEGAKQVWLGEQVLEYAKGEALLVSISLLAKGVITRASATDPFLGISIELDVAVLREVASVLEHENDPKPATTGLSVHVLEPEIIDCMVRLTRLLKTPEALHILYPGVLRELSYWLLKGDTGAELRALVSPDGPSIRIEQALAHLRSNFTMNVRVEDLAAAAGMSVTSFHRHFKALTGSTPIKYQKQLRLVEARRILDAGADNVTSTAFAVGYESPAQFSRDYTLFYGISPKRDTLSRRLSLSLS